MKHSDPALMCDGMKGVKMSGYAVVVEGRSIPRLTMRDHSSDKITLILDGRFAIDVPKEHAQPFAWMIANALAIGEGYAFLGSENKEKPFAPQVARL